MCVDGSNMAGFKGYCEKCKYFLKPNMKEICRDCLANPRYSWFPGNTPMYFVENKEKK